MNLTRLVDDIHDAQRQFIHLFEIGPHPLEHDLPLDVHRALRVDRARVQRRAYPDVRPAERVRVRPLVRVVLGFVVGDGAAVQRVGVVERDAQPVALAPAAITDTDPKNATKKRIPRARLHRIACTRWIIVSNSPQIL